MVCLIRLIACGFLHEGVDYYETFTPIIKPATICVILCLALQFNWQLR